MMRKKKTKNDIIDKGKYVAQETSSDSEEEQNFWSLTEQLSNPFSIKTIKPIKNNAKLEFYKFSKENLQSLATHNLLSFPHKSCANKAQESSDEDYEDYDPNILDLSEFEVTNSSIPLAISSPIKSITFIKSQPQVKTYYKHKSNAKINVLQMEKEFWGCDPNNVSLKIFPPGFHFRPTQLNKSHAFYRLILVDTKSIRIKHFLDEYDPNNIINSTFQILKVLKFSDWGEDPNQIKKFSQNFDPEGYNYWDYIDAWYCTFWYQNKYFKHSWYIFFNNYWDQYEFPLWFKKWWDLFGPCEEILPESVQQGLKTFSECFNQEEGDFFPIDLHFFSKLSLGWISQWDYKYDDEEHHDANPNVLPILQRVVKTKWWGKSPQSWGSHEAVQNWFISHPNFLRTSINQKSEVFNQEFYMGDAAIPSTSNGFYSSINNGYQIMMKQVNSEEDENNDDDDADDDDVYEEEEEPLTYEYFCEPIWREIKDLSFD